MRDDEENFQIPFSLNKFYDLWFYYKITDMCPIKCGVLAFLVALKMYSYDQNGLKPIYPSLWYKRKYSDIIYYYGKRMLEVKSPLLPYTGNFTSYFGGTYFRDLKFLFS